MKTKDYITEELLEALKKDEERERSFINPYSIGSALYTLEEYKNRYDSSILINTINKIEKEIKRGEVENKGEGLNGILNSYFLNIFSLVIGGNN